MIRLCIPLKMPAAIKGAARKAWLSKNIRRASQAGQFVELWCDTLTHDEIAYAIAQSKIPVVVKGVRGIGSGAQHIDLDVSTPASVLKKVDATLILSRHIWSGTPTIEVLMRYVAAAVKKGAAIVKIATTVKKWSDASVLLECATRLSHQKIPFVIVGMGEKGVVARIGCALLGGEWTYAALEEKLQTAPGQLIVGKMPFVC